MNDALDGALDGSEDEAEGEEIMNQVLDEIGIEISAKAASVPRSQLPALANDRAEKNQSEIEARLKSLRHA